MEDTELQTMEPEETGIPGREEEAHLSNACDYNEAHLAEAVRQQMQQTRRLQNLLLGATLTVLLVYSLILWFRLRQTRYLIFGGAALLVGLLLLYMVFLLPGKSAKAQVEKIRQKNGGIRFRTVFRPEGIGFLAPSGQETTTVSYRTVDKVVTGRDLILLFTAEKQMLLLDPGRFENGTEADFWKLMNEYCPSAVPKTHKA